MDQENIPKLRRIFAEKITIRVRICRFTPIATSIRRKQPPPKWAERLWKFVAQRDQGMAEKQSGALPESQFR